MVETSIKPKWTAIEIEETSYLDPVIRFFVKRLWTVYKFDRNLVTHICSQDKHYLLEPLYVNIEFQNGVDEADQDRIHSDFSNLGDADYLLVRNIERLIETGQARIAEYGELDEDETEDDVREHWLGNCPL